MLKPAVVQTAAAMAIAHLNMRAGTRANGATAAGLAEYVLREGRHAAKADELVHTESGNMPGWVRGDPSAYWQAADEFERANGCLFREIEFALPRELSRAQQIELATAFCRHLTDSRKLPWTMALHDAGTGNPHVHLLLSERQNDGIERSRELWFRRFNPKAPEKGGARKAQDLGVFAKWTVTVRAEWEEFANAALERAERAERICMASYATQGIDLTPGSHRGAAGHMAERGIETERAQEQARRSAEQRAQVEANPVSVLDRLTHTQATFTRRDIARELGRHVDEPHAFANLMARIEASPDLMLLREAQGRSEAIYSTRSMVEAEAMMQGHATAMARRRTHALPARAHAMKKGEGLGTVIGAVVAGRELSEEQQAALSHVLGPEQIALVAGGAGTGKSTMLGAARLAWEAEGYRVIGAALAGKAADELRSGSGIRCSTIASLELRLKKGKAQLGARDVLVIDEAGMVGSRQMGRVLEAAQKAGAKVVLVGDAEQLQPIEAGAAFRAIAERIGFAEISTVRRQREDWARDASRAFARGQTRAGLEAYEQHGAIRSVGTRDEARAAIAADYLAGAKPGESRIILAHSNRDVTALNQAVRQARMEHGELGAEVAFSAERGARQFAVGDRLVFLQNDRRLGVKNGMLGTVIAGRDGQLTVALDGQDGRRVTFGAEGYAAVDHGYAVTLHKAQGVTVDRAYVLATPGMDRHLAYVGMTRHREKAQLYYGRDDFERKEDLYRILSRARPATTTLDFAERRGIETRRGWLETGRDALATLGRRLEACIAQIRQLVAASRSLRHRTWQEDRAAGADAKDAAPVRRGMFDGLKLHPSGSGRLQAGRGPFDGMSLPTSRPAPLSSGLSSDRLADAVERYAGAWTGIEKMRAQGLPVLEGQRAALRDAGAAMDAARPGSVKDLTLALRYDPQTRAAMEGRTGPARGAALVAGIELEAQERANPAVRAARYVASWKALEAAHHRHDGRDEAETRSGIAARMQKLSGVIGRDTQARKAMAAAPAEFGIKPDSLFMRVVRGRSLPQIEPKELSRTIERDLTLGRGLVPELGGDRGREIEPER